MIRDKIMFLAEDPALKERLLREPKLDLWDAVDIYLDLWSWHRVAQVKCVTLPRLELLAAYITAKLLDNVI